MPNELPGPETKLTAESVTPDPKRRRLGLALTLTGSTLALLWLLDQTAPLPLPMPRTWHLHRVLWGSLGGLLALIGLWLQRDRTGEERAGEMGATTWRARQPGLRFERVVLYSRPGCHLCHEVQNILEAYGDYLPAVIEVDIDGNPELQSRFGTLIPVVEIDGRERFRGRLDEALLRRLIDATPPVA